MRTPTLAFAENPEPPEQTPYVLRYKARFLDDPVTQVQPVERWISEATRNGLWHTPLMDAPFADARRLYDLHPKMLQAVLETLIRKVRQDSLVGSNEVVDETAMATPAEPLQHRRSYLNCTFVNSASTSNYNISPTTQVPKIAPTDSMEESSVENYREVRNPPAPPQPPQPPQNRTQSMAYCILNCVHCKTLSAELTEKDSEVRRLIEKLVETGLEIVKISPGAIAGVKRKLSEAVMDHEGDVVMRDVRHRPEDWGSFTPVAERLGSLWTNDATRRRILDAVQPFVAPTDQGLVGGETVERFQGGNRRGRGGGRGGRGNRGGRGGAGLRNNRNYGGGRFLNNAGNYQSNNDGGGGLQGDRVNNQSNRNRGGFQNRRGGNNGNEAGNGGRNNGGRGRGNRWRGR